MVNFWRWFNCFNDNSPLSTTFEQSVTCNSLSEVLTWASCSRASFSRCLQRFRIMCSIALHPLKCSKPNAIIDESVASTTFNCVDAELPNCIELYSFINCLWFENCTAPPFLTILRWNEKKNNMKFYRFHSQNSKKIANFN